MKGVLASLSASLLGPLLAAAATAQGPPILDLGYAKYEGFFNKTSDVNTWLGVKYAQAPIGDLRWQAPRSIEQNNNFSTTVPMNATVPGPTCVQGWPVWSTDAQTVNTFPPSGAEDCLLLNIQVPANPTSSALPIMIFVHGGGYDQGFATQATGDNMIKQSKGDFIWASIQYRLGAYGFLSGAEVKANGVPNAGLLDQREGIEWVQRNARAFGGDPTKITILGGSAGGGAVMTQMIMYGGVASPPFRAVISQYPWWQSFKTDDILENQFQFLLKESGCADIACLRSLGESDLATAYQKIFISAYKVAGGYGYGDYFFGPSVDGTIIQDLPSNEFKQGHFTKVPLLVGRDGFEGVPFSNQSAPGDPASVLEDMQQIFPGAGQSFLSRLDELYPQSNFNSSFFRRAQWFGDFIVECPTYYIASALSDAGIPAFKFLFYAGSEVHGATSPYLYFENNDGTPQANDTIGAYMKDWFVSFTTTLDPNTKDYSGLKKPNWPLYQTSNSSFDVMQVNFTMIGQVKDFDVTPQCDFFHSQSFVTRN